MKNVLLFVLIPVALLGTLGILGVGIYSLAKGGEFSKAYSNKLMRWRVTAQAVAIALLLILVLVLSQGD